MGNHALNYFGTNGPSENLFHPGQPLDFSLVWQEEWDDGNEPPHHEGMWLSVEELDGEDEIYEQEYQLDDYDEPGEYPFSPLLAHNREPTDFRELYQTIESVVLVEPVDLSNDSGIVVHPTTFSPRHHSGVFKDGPRKFPNSKAKRSMPYWRTKPGCRRTIRQQPLIIREKVGRRKVEREVVQLTGHFPPAH